MCKFNKLFNSIFNREGKVLSKNGYLRDLAVEYIWKFIGTQYRWGGNTPMTGFDCEGIVSEALEAVGLVPDKADYRAQGLFDRFKNRGVSIPKKGCLVFYGKNTNTITHVSMCVDDFHVIEAAGGGSSTTNTADAVRRLAFVKIRPMARRQDIVAFIDPFKT